VVPAGGEEVGLVGGDGGHDVIVLAEGDVGALLGRLVRVPQEHAAFVAAGSHELSLLARKGHISVARVWSNHNTHRSILTILKCNQLTN